MALYLPIRAISRSQNVRIGSQRILPIATSYVDISDGKTRRELMHHQAIGSIITVGALTASNSGTVVTTGVVVSEGVSATDLIISATAGELRNRSTGASVAVAATDVTLSAAHATLVRIDIVQVHTTTGVVTKKSGTAAASPVAATPDAGNISVAEINVPATDTAITNNQITDVRPRP